MKKFLFLVPIFLIYSCTSVAPTSKVIQSSHDITIISSKAGKKHSWKSIIVQNYEDLNVGVDADRAEAMSIETGEKFHIGNYPIGFFWANEYSIESTVINNCERLFKTDCVLSRTDKSIVGTMTGNEKGGKNRVVNTYFKNLSDYKNKEEQKRKRLVELNKQAEQEAKLVQKRQEEKRLAVIHALKERCISYGFTGNNNIAACVQREAKHDYEIEQKDYELELARQQIIAQQNQQPVSTEVPWYLSILEAVSEGIAEGYERKALIQSLDARYQRKDIYRYCRPNC